MHNDNEAAARAATPRKRGLKPRWNERLRPAEALVPAFAVGLVAITAVAAAVMATRPDTADTTEAVPLQADTALERRDVVMAPPLKPPSEAAARAAPKNLEASASVQSLGAGPACRNCGVVQMVVAVHGYAQPRPSGYQMHIRMDDGSVRTVEQRGALAPGSRVIVERDSVRVLAERPKQG